MNKVLATLGLVVFSFAAQMASASQGVSVNADCLRDYSYVRMSDGKSAVTALEVSRLNEAIAHVQNEAQSLTPAAGPFVSSKFIDSSKMTVTLCDGRDVTQSNCVEFYVAFKGGQPSIQVVEEQWHMGPDSALLLCK